MKIITPSSSVLFKKFWDVWHIVAIGIILGSVLAANDNLSSNDVAHVVDIHIPTFEEYPSPGPEPDIIIEDEDGTQVPAWIA